MDFLHLVFIGEMVTFKGNLNMVGRTSMETGGGRIEAENLITGEIRHINSAYLTLVVWTKMAGQHLFRLFYSKHKMIDGDKKKRLPDGGFAR